MCPQGLTSSSCFLRPWPSRYGDESGGVPRRGASRSANGGAAATDGSGADTTGAFGAGEATAEAGDPEAALEMVDRLELDGYRYMYSTRAEILVRLSRIDEACAAYRRALELVHDETEQRLFARRLNEITADSSSTGP